MKLFRWFSDRFRDLFFGQGNVAADLGRVIAGLSVLAVIGGEIWNVHLGLPIEIDKLGIALAAVITADAALIYAKDRAKTESKAVDAIPAVPVTPAPKAAKPLTTKELMK